MLSQDASILIMKQHELIQQYDKFIECQRHLINGLWEHIYMLHKISLDLGKTDTDIDKVSILANMSYAALQAGRSGEAIEKANENPQWASDQSLEIVKRLMQDLEDMGNNHQA